MEYITIKKLKKEAKELRKNNLQFKNHAESLNAVAQEQGYKNWESLLNTTVLLKKQSDNGKELFEKILSTVFEEMEYLRDILTIGNGYYLGCYINNKMVKFSRQ